jgi:hypothetical protein
VLKSSKLHDTLNQGPKEVYGVIGMDKADLYQKYVQAVPFYRQEKDWLRLGFDLSHSTIANWVIRSCEDWLKPWLTE